MRKTFLGVMIFIFVFSLFPVSGLRSPAREGKESFYKYWKPDDEPTDLTTGTITENITHTFNLHVVFVGYDENMIDTALIDANIGHYYELPYWDAFMKCTFSINYTFASRSYFESLRTFIIQHSVSGTGITSAMNETALQYQRETGTRMSIFLPQSGMAIDAYAVEQWFADNPYGYANDDDGDSLDYERELGYTFYILNFTEFDSPDHSWEHWFNFTRYDVEAKSINDYWRLEWDNPLNPDVKFPYTAFTSRYRLLFLDPSAFQWYLTWARIWWGLDPYLIGPKYDYYYEDLDSFLASHDVTKPEGRNSLALYLAGWIDDFLFNLLSPVIWSETGNTLSLQVLVLNNVSQYGYPNEEMKWILNSTLVEEAVKELAPYMQVQVSVRFENLSSYPEIEQMLNDTFLEERDGWKYYDGYQLFFALHSVRDQYFYMKAAEVTVNGYVFLLRNASMETGPGGMEFTGLGGLRQVLLLKSIDRYFRPDSVTPKSGLGMMMIHELGHNLGMPHTFSFMRYAGDFANDAMGYYSYCYSYCKMRTDMFRRTAVDMKLLELKKALRADATLRWPWPTETLFFREHLFDVIKSKINLSMQMYDKMDYLDSYYEMLEAESLEAYMREIIMGLRVPGDIDSDGKCDLADVFALFKAYGSTPSSPNWNPDADLNKDGIVNFMDWKILQKFFGEKAIVEVGFFRWKTGARTTIIDVGAFIFPEWDMPYTEMNITYGLCNWGKRPRLCFTRISDMTLSNLIKSVNVRIYNQTTTVAEITWASGAPTPTDWVKFIPDPSTKYSIMIEVIGTMEAFYEMTVITLECRESSG